MEWVVLPSFRLLLPALFASLTIAPIAKASERDDARALVYRGDDLFAERRYADALDAYKRADDMMHVPTTTIEVAKTLVVLGRLHDAREIAEALASGGLASEPPAFFEARARAKALVSEIDDRLASLSVSISPAPPGAELKVQSETASWSVAPGETLKLDPGTYTVVVVARGYAGETRTVELVEHERVPLEIPLRLEHRPPMLAIGALVLSGVAVTAATGTGIAWAATRPEPGPLCPAATCSAASKAQTLGTIAGVSLGIGLAAGAAGAISWAIDAKASHDGSTSAVVVSPGFTGYRATF
jgi:hypothetical protein